MTTLGGQGAIGKTETVPGLQRQIGADVDYLTMLKHNYVKSLVPQIVVPNNAWMGAVKNGKKVKPMASTDLRNSWSRTIIPPHDFREKQVFYGN